MRAHKYLPLPHPLDLSSPPLLPPCVSFLCSKKGSMLSARVPLRDPLLLLHGGRLPPLYPESLEAAPGPPAFACWAESTCYDPPREGMACTLGMVGRGWGHLGHRPHPQVELGSQAGLGVRSAGHRGRLSAELGMGACLGPLGASHSGWAQDGQDRLSQSPPPS